MHSGHKRPADDGESSEARASRGSPPAQETSSVCGGRKKSNAEDILNRSSAATEQFEKKKMTEDAYNAAILEMMTEFVRDVLVFKARVFDRSLTEICHGLYAYGDDGAKEMTRKAAEAECECAFRILSNEQKKQFFYRNVGYDDEFHACGSSMKFPSPIKLRHVRIAFGATGEKRECNVSSTLSDADFTGAIRRASEKVLGRADGYAIVVTKFIAHAWPDRPGLLDRIVHKLDTKEQMCTHFERIMHQQDYDYRHNHIYY